jgi:hypothetical protein
MEARNFRTGWIIPLTLLIFAGCGEVGADQEEVPPLELHPGQLTSSQKCGSCHKDIYSVWRSSIHARAASTPVFLEAYDEAVQETGDTARKMCLRCHAPSSIVTGNLVLSDSLNQEGVNCDFCHSLVGVDPNNPVEPFKLEVGTTKYGPVQDAEPRGHPVAFSKFHTTSEHCEGCHEYRNPAGVSLLSTYSEWADYQQKGGDRTCQECHMPLVVASVVDPKVLRVRSSFINLHSMPGGHSLAQLVKALRLRIEEVKRDGRKVYVKLSLKNAGAGHAVPTGSPTRKILLDITATAESGEVAQQQYTFQKVALDAQSKPIMDDARMFLDTARIGDDTRIAPGEERIIETSFTLPTDENIEVRASLTYLYSPHNRPETETRLEFVSERKQLVAAFAR